MSDGDNLDLFLLSFKKLLSLKKIMVFYLQYVVRMINQLLSMAFLIIKILNSEEKDIVSYRINWETKSSNIKEIIDELNISLSHTIFIDDSEYECDEVKNNCPGITIINVPKDIYKYPEIFQDDCFLSMILEKKILIELLYIKIESSEKNLLKEISKTSNSKDDWIKSLNIKIIFERVNILSKSKKGYTVI